MRSLLLTGVLLSGCSGNDPSEEDDVGAETGSTEAVCGPDADFGLEVGQCALDFTLPDSTGADFTLSDQRGKVALVDISAVW